MKNTLKHNLAFYKYPKITCGIKTFDLQMFAGEKTEPATEKKRREARQKGNVAKSQDLGSVAILMTGFIMLKVYGPYIYASCGAYMRFIMEQGIFTNINLRDTLVMFSQLVIIIVKMLAPFLLMLGLVSIGINIAQTGFLFRFDPLIPDIDRLNPISGIQNVFSWKLVAELIKSILKILIVAYIPYSTMTEKAPLLIKFVKLKPIQSISILINIILNLALKIIVVLLVLAIADWFFQKWRYEENLKMSKEEIKEEYKQREGDPKVKQKIRERQRQAASRRMMEEVPKATVVVTNPTHIACALKYDNTVHNAPVVVAMGAGKIAQRIKEIAKENNVPVFENKPLARALYKMVDIGDEIPTDLYGAVVEILVKVRQLQNNY